MCLHGQWLGIATLGCRLPSSDLRKGKRLKHTVPTQSHKYDS